MKTRAYPKYKSSGVEWLGDVPEHWVLKRSRYMLSMNPSKQEANHLDFETELAFLPMEAVGGDGSLRLDATRPISEVSTGYTFFAEGDVAFAKITPCFENGKGAIMRGLGTGCGFGTTELTVMRPGKDLDVEYLYYLSISDEFRKNGEAWMYGAGGQKRVPDDYVKEFRFCFPPLPEQQAIATFLDGETGRIDALLGKKERLLELLAEQRSTLISRAVTKGLDATVMMKPSSVEWLGDVPEHWVLKRSRYMLSMNPSKQEANHLDFETELAFLPMEAVGGDGSLRLDATRPISEVSTGYTFFAEGDVAFAKITPCFENGKGAIMRGLGTGCGFGTTELTVMRPGKDLDVEYLYYLSISDEFRKNGEAWMYGAGGQKRVPDDYVKEFRFCFPPLPEQQAIAAFLDRETSKIDILSAKVKTVIEKLKEYRTALISAAVTGKIDVREAV